MSEARIITHEDIALVRVELDGDVGDAEIIAAFETLLRDMPQARGWSTLVDMRKYDGGITWRGAMRIANIRGHAEPGPMNRTAVIAQSGRYEGLIVAIDMAYGVMIGRRVLGFETEEEAMAWLGEP